MSDQANIILQAGNPSVKLLDPLEVQQKQLSIAQGETSLKGQKLQLADATRSSLVRQLSGLISDEEQTPEKYHQVIDDAVAMNPQLAGPANQVRQMIDRVGNDPKKLRQAAQIALVGTLSGQEAAGWVMPEKVTFDDGRDMHFGQRNKVTGQIQWTSSEPSNKMTNAERQRLTSYKGPNGEPLQTTTGTAVDAANNGGQLPGYQGTGTGAGTANNTPAQSDPSFGGSTGGYPGNKGTGATAPTAQPPVVQTATSPASPPAASPIVTNVGALNGDGTVNPGSGANPQSNMAPSVGASPSPAPVQPPVGNMPPVNAPAAQASPVIAQNAPTVAPSAPAPVMSGGNRLTGIAPGASLTVGAPTQQYAQAVPGRAGAIQVGPSPQQQANVAADTAVTAKSSEGYIALQGSSEIDRQLVNNLRMLRDASYLTVTGEGADRINSVRSNLATVAQAAGVQVSPEMNQQAIASALLNKASANIINNNPMSGHALGMLESIAHGTPNINMPGEAIREVALQMLATAQMRQYLRQTSTPQTFLMDQAQASVKLDPTAFVFDLMDDKAKANYVGQIKEEKNADLRDYLKNRFVYTRNEIKNTNMVPPGGTTGNMLLPPGQSPPARQPNVFTTPGFPGAAPTNTNPLTGP